MNGNFYYQQHTANERIASRRREAAQHAAVRQAKLDDTPAPASSLHAAAVTAMNWLQTQAVRIHLRPATT